MNHHSFRRLAYCRVERSKGWDFLPKLEELRMGINLSEKVAIASFSWSHFGDCMNYRYLLESSQGSQRPDWLSSWRRHRLPWANMHRTSYTWRQSSIAPFYSGVQNSTMMQEHEQRLLRRSLHLSSSWKSLVYAYWPCTSHRLLRLEHHQRFLISPGSNFAFEKSIPDAMLSSISLPLWNLFSLAMMDWMPVSFCIVKNSLALGVISSSRHLHLHFHVCA